MAPDRDSNGRFSPGNQGGPGRPRRATERAYLAAMSDTCSVEDWKEIVHRAITDAKSGDPRARTWLSEFLVGRVEPGAEPLHRLAVEEEAGSDPVGLDAARRQQTDLLDGLLTGSRP